MKILVRTVILCLFAHFTYGDVCSYNFTLSDLPEGVVDEVLSFIGGLTINRENCDKFTLNEANIKFYISTRCARQPTPIESNTILNAKMKTIVLLHGWLCNINNELLPDLREAYLKEYDANIIMIDWSAYSGFNYAESYCYLPKIAKVIGKFLCNAADFKLIDISSLHVVGHSMGGQLSGLVGQELQLQCGKKTFRITALDPAGPLYQGASNSKRLDSSDATIVDVIHTNAGFLGYAGNCGTVDFYPNMGVFQSGCLAITDSLIYPFGCSHLRSMDYMIESVTSNKFTGKSCLFCGGCVLNILSGYKAVMGEHYAYEKSDCGYYLYTNDKAPYAQD